MIEFKKLPQIPLNKTINVQADRFSVTSQEITFLEDDLFVNAWNEALREVSAKAKDIQISKIFWRAHIASSLFANCFNGGAYVECGTHLGLISRVVFKLHRDKVFKKFLFDTWTGVPESQFSSDEPLAEWHNRNNYTEDTFEFVRSLQTDFSDLILVRGAIPETLTSDYNDIAPSFLHIDMNIEYPERKALEFFVPQMKPGSVVLLDDYGFSRHSKQRHSQDYFFSQIGKQPTQLPTGQAFVLM